MKSSPVVQASRPCLLPAHLAGRAGLLRLQKPTSSNGAPSRRGPCVIQDDDTVRGCPASEDVGLNWLGRREVGGCHA